MKGLIRILGVTAAVILLAGCFARVRENRYYLLDYVPTPSAERLQKGPYPFSLRIKDFDVAEAYRRNNIVYRQSPHELRFYSYELWAVKPEYLVTDMVYRHFEAAKLFHDVARSLDMVEPEYVLSGQVTALEEYDNKDEWYAHLAMAMTLQNTRTRQVVWSKSWDFRKKVRQLEPVFVVRELSALLEVATEDAVASLEAALAGMDSSGVSGESEAVLSVEPAAIPQPGLMPQPGILPPPSSTMLPLPERIPLPSGAHP